MNATEIKIKLLELGITQKDLADKWKKTEGTVSRVINRSLISEALDKKLARALKVSIDELRSKDLA